MVSTDGPSVTPDEPDPRAKTETEGRDVPVAKKIENKIPSEPTAGEDAAPEQSADTFEREPAAEPDSPKTPDATTADEAGVLQSSQKPKKQKLSRKQRKINRLVMEFQPDAVEMEHRKVAGGLRWTLYVVILLLIGAVAWAWWARVDRVVSAEGRLISTKTFIVNAPQTGPIRSIEVNFGDTVKAGQKLATLDPTFSEADVAKLETRSNSMLAKLRRLEAEQAKREFVIESGKEIDPVWITEQIVFRDRQRKTNAINEEYDAEYRKLLAQKEKNEADVKAQEDLIKHREVRLRQAIELYEKRAGTKNDVDDAEAELNFNRSQLVTAQSTVRETEAQFKVIEKQRESLLAERQEAVSLELAQARQQHNEVIEDLTKARFANEMVIINAPEDFPEYKVIEIADRSSVVSPGQSIMKLIPTNAPLEVEVKVDAKDIALIRDSTDGKAKEVRIKLSAFPYMKHGALRGYVKTINEDITEEGQPGMTRSFYTVRIQLDESNDAPQLRDVPIRENHYKPGMSVTAEIKVGRRRVIDYFIYPIFRSLDTSIREP